MVKRFILSVVLMATTLLTVAQTTVTVGTGTSTTRTTPFCNYYNNGSVAMIYDASNFDAACDISSIAFEVSTAISKTASIHIYMGVKSSATFAGSTDWVPASDLTEVYSDAEATIGKETGWEEYSFANPYSYNPANGHLVVVVTRQSSTYSSAYAYKYTSTSNAVLYKQNDTDATVGDLASVVLTSGTRGYELPNTQFKLNYTGAVCNRPTSNPTASHVTSNSADITWGAAEGAGSYQYVVVTAGSAVDWTNAVMVNTNSAQVTGLNPNTQYDVYVRSYCDAVLQSQAINGTFRTECSAVAPEVLGVVGFETSEGFTTGNGNAPGNCWQVGNMQSTTGYKPYVATYSGSAYEGSNYMSFSACSSSYTSADGAYAILPELDFSGNGGIQGYTMSFRFHKTSTGATYNDTLYVAVLKDASDVMNYEIVGKVVNTTTTYAKGTVNLANYTQDVTGRIMLLAKVDANNTSSFKYASFYVDNVEIQKSKSCAAPDSLNVFDVTATSANLNWYGTSAQYRVVVSDSAVNPLTNTVWVKDTLVSSPSIALAGLNAMTHYYVYVQGICGVGDESNFADPVDFSTSCVEVSALPWQEDFSTYDASTVPMCWDNEEGTTTTASYKWLVYSDSGNKCMRFDSYYNDYGNTNLLKSPQIVIPDRGADLVFDWKNPAGGNYQLYISEDGGATLGTVVKDNMKSQSSWKTEEISLSAYAGKTITIVWKGISNNGYGSAYLYLDNVKVLEKPACQKVGNIRQEGATTTTTATLAWTPEQVAPNYAVVVKNGSDTILNTTVSQPQVTLTGLTSGTVYTYTVLVKSLCSATETSDEVSGSVTFATQCDAITALPWSEGFEDHGVGNHTDPAPLCWDMLNCNKGNYPYLTVGTMGTYVHSGTKHLFFQSGIKRNAYAIFPTITADLSGAELAFYYKNEGASAANGTLNVGYVTDASDSASFVLLQSMAQVSTVTEAVVSLSTVPAGARLAFEYVGGTGSNMYLGIDDITVRPATTCHKVSGIHVIDSLSTATTATVVWNPSENNAPYRVLVKSGSDTLVSNVMTTDTFCVITNLTPATPYTFSVSVTAVCSATDESETVTATVSATTQCVTITTLPWEADFEAYTSGTLPQCWDNAEGTTTTASYKWLIYSTSGNKFMRFNSYYNSTNNTNLLKSPLIQLPEESADLFFDWMNPTGGNYQLYISLDGGETLGEVVKDNMKSQTSWKTEEISLAAYAGKTITLVWKGISNCGSGDAYLYLDNVKVKLTPTCQKVQNIRTEGDATTTTAVLAWTPQTVAPNYGVVVKNGADTILNTTVDQPQVTLTGLTPGKEYSLTVLVKALCSATDASEEVSGTVSFATQCEAIATLPWSEGFEDYAKGTTTSAAPVCWDMLNCNGTSTPTLYVNNTSAYVNTGSKALYMDSYKGRQAIAIFPEITADLSNAELAFYYKHEGVSTYNGVLSVGYITDVTDSSKFVALQTLPQVASFTEVIQPLSGVPAGARLAFSYMGGNGSNYHLGIDDITIRPLTTCHKVSGIHAIDSLSTESSVTIAWNASENAPSQYRVLVKNGTQELVSNALVSDTVLVVNNLSSSTSYSLSVSVTAICGPDDESETVTTTVKVATACGVISSFPWTEDFESYETNTTADNIPCFDSYSVSGTANKWSVVGASNAHASNRALSIKYTSSSLGRTVAGLELPEMLFESGSQYVINYWLSGTASGTSDTIGVYVGSQQLQSLNTRYDIGSAWKEYSDTIVGDGSVKSILFTFSNKDGYFAYLDDITVSKLMATCDTVSNIHVADSTTTSVTIAWDAVVDASYIVLVKLGGDTLVNDTLTEAQAIVSGLTENTAYVFDVTVVTIAADKLNSAAVSAQVAASTKAQEIVTGLDDAATETKVVKIIRDNQVFILRDGVLYDTTGRKVK